MVSTDPQLRRLARQLTGFDKRLHDLETVPQLAHSSIDDGTLPVYDKDGTLVVAVGRQPDGTWGAPPLAGPTPSAPIGVSATGGAGIVHVRWTGDYFHGAAPLDFDALEVLIDDRLAGAIPNRDGGTVTIEADQGTRFISARIRTLAPRHSAPTSPFTVEVGPPADQLFIEARDAIETAEGDIADAKQEIIDERTAREAALKQAAEDLAELDGKLADLPSSSELDEIRDDLAAAQGVAESARSVATEANTAANAASQAALEAAGIAASKGRVIVQETEPMGEDRKASNIWIQPVPDDPDTEIVENAVTYVYLEASDEWQPTTSSELAQAAQNALDAREAAQQAQQRADTAVSNAATSQAAAEAAQTTANTATLDAAEAHNAAVAAQEGVDAAIERGDSLLINGSFEQGDLGWPTGGSHGGRSRIIEDPAARTGRNVLELAPTTANVYPESDFIAVEPGQILRVRGWFKHLGGNGTRVGLLVRHHDANKGYLRVLYATVNTGVQNWAIGEWTLLEGEVQVPSDVRWFRFAFHATGPSTSTYHADDYQVVDVTEARAAQAAAETARALAASKPGMTEVETAIATSANGKNAITISAAEPTSSTPGVVVGDTWWRVDGSGQIFGQWRWTSLPAGWVPASIRSEVIANLDVGKLVVTGTSRFTEAVIDRLFADLFVAHKITAEQITIAALDEDGNLAPGSVGAITLQDGIVGADKIIADEVAAEVSNLVRANVEKLTVTEGATINEAVIMKIAAEMITSGVLRTADAGQRVVIDGTGIVMYGLDPDGIDYEMVRIGPSGDNLITLGDTTVSASGIQAPSGDFEQITIGGQTLVEYLDPAPSGVVARGWNNVSGRTIGPNGETELGEMYVPLVPGRGYQISVEPISAYVPRGGRLGLNIYVESGTDDSPAKSPSLKTSRLYRGIVYRDSGGDRPMVVFQGQHYAWATQETHWRLLFTFNAYDSTDVGTVYNASDWASGVLRVSVTDVGLHQEFTMIDRTGRTSTEPTPPEPTPPPVKKRYTKTYSATDYYTYDNNGNRTSDPDVVQGLYAGGPSSRLRKGGWRFPSMTGDLSGATIEKVRVKLYVDHTYYTAGATVNVCTWGGVLRDNLTVIKTYTGWKRGTSKWITLPSSTHAGFKSGAIDGVGVKPTNTFAEQFARLATSAKIEITYVK